ncbi:MAG: cation:dicarboxylase symporter family transporter [Lachnospiraceae bacterium]|nr:cation:dicarboxylase symporter family transporter [Lachnospiraceae bacterium]
MKKDKVFALQKYEIGEATQFVQNCLEEFGIRPGEAMKGTLIAEEAIGSLIQHAASSGELRISVRKLFGSVTVEMSAPGTEYPLSENMESASLTFDEELGREAQDAIRNIILRSFADDLKYSHKDGYNYIRMTLVKSKRAFLYATLLSLVLSVLAGLLLSAAAPSAFNAGLDRYLLTPVKTAYMNVLKMAAAPVVFFSIVSCIGGFSDLRELGKVGGRTVLLYALTTVIAVSVGIGAFGLFLCMSNCTGDVVVTTIVARKADEIDMDVYQS